MLESNADGKGPEMPARAVSLASAQPSVLLRFVDRPPPSCTNWTRLVLLPVLTGHVSSHGPRSPCCGRRPSFPHRLEKDEEQARQREPEVRERPLAR